MKNQKRYLLKDILEALGVSRSGYYKWERMGKIPKPKRDPMSGYRYWTEADLKQLKRKTGR